MPLMSDIHIGTMGVPSRSWRDYRDDSADDDEFLPFSEDDLRLIGFNPTHMFMDAGKYEEQKHRRESKGSGKGGQFATKPHALETPEERTATMNRLARMEPEELLQQYREETGSKRPPTAAMLAAHFGIDLRGDRKQRVELLHKRAQQEKAQRGINEGAGQQQALGNMKPGDIIEKYQEATGETNFTAADINEHFEGAIPKAKLAELDRYIREADENYEGPDPEYKAFAASFAQHQESIRTATATELVARYEASQLEGNDHDTSREVILVSDIVNQFGSNNISREQQAQLGRVLEERNGRVMAQRQGIPAEVSHEVLRQQAIAAHAAIRQQEQRQAAPQIDPATDQFRQMAQGMSAEQLTERFISENQRPPRNVFELNTHFDFMMSAEQKQAAQAHLVAQGFEVPDPQKPLALVGGGGDKPVASYTKAVQAIPVDELIKRYLEETGEDEADMSVLDINNHFEGLLSQKQTEQIASHINALNHYDMPTPGDQEHDYDSKPLLQEHADSVAKDMLGFFKKAFPDGELRYARVEEGTKITVSMHVPGTNTTMTREFDFLDGTVEHAYFEVDKNFRGQNTKSLMKDQMNYYESSGFNTVTVHANIDIGGYTWAKYGFVPYEHSWDSLKKELVRKIDDHLQVIDESFDRADDEEDPYNMYKDEAANDFVTEARALQVFIEDSNDPRDIWEVADNTTKTFDPSDNKFVSHTSLGKHILLGRDWYGSFDLYDTDQQERLNAYASKRKAAS